MADVALFAVEDYREIPYFFGENRCARVVSQGELVWSRDPASAHPSDRA
jgi:imidazolonepropionase-like amidohydrolase